MREREEGGKSVSEVQFVYRRQCTKCLFLLGSIEMEQYNQQRKGESQWERVGDYEWGGGYIILMNKCLSGSMYQTWGDWIEQIEWLFDTYTCMHTAQTHTNLIVI